MRLSSAVLAAVMIVLPGCATLQQYAALHQVTWSFDGVSGVRLVGIPLTSDIESYASLGVANAARLLESASRGELPLELTAHVGATNPETNTVSARLTDLDWTLFIEDTRTVAGKLGNTYSIPPGETVDVPVPVTLDLFDFYEGSAVELFNVALAIAGGGSEPRELRLELIPAIETPLGPITYPAPLVVRHTVGE